MSCNGAWLGCRPDQTLASGALFDDGGEAAEVAAAAAASIIVNAALFAPGRLLYVRLVEGGVDDGTSTF